MMRRAAALLAVALCGCGSSDNAAKKAAPPAQPKITQFYASPGIVGPGESTSVCYGVENAVSLRLDPPVEELKPSYNRCFQVSPKQTTTYTLTAVSAAGAEVSEKFSLLVDNSAAAAPAPSPEALILFFTASSVEVSANQPVTLCYGVKGAARVSLQPNIYAVKALERDCFSRAFESNVKLTLTAFDAQGRRDSETVAIRVR